jgi:glycosyltransferase involved in cell wall biosynthesis
MRVLLTLSSLQVGGAERNVVSVLPHMRAQGIEVALCTLGTRPDSFLAGEVERLGVPRFDLGARRLLDIPAFMRFLRLIRAERMEILHGEDQYGALFCALAAKLTGTPFVYTRHNEEEETPSFNYRLRAGLTLRAAREARRVIAVSEAIRALLHRQTQIPIERITTIYNGINTNRFDTRSLRARKRVELGWREEEVIVLMVAVIRKDKGHDVLFETLPALRGRIPNLKIKIVGDGPYAEIRRREAAQFSDCVEFLGQRDDVPALLGAADLLVSPSRTEALPTAPIEAGAAGLTVVATDVGGTREVVEDGVTGFLVPSGDAGALTQRVAEILTTPDLATRMGEAARSRILRMFTLERQAENTARLYRQVLNHSARQ